jgi:hypothetical protein
MTNEQLYLAVGIPMLFNAAMIDILIAYMNTRFGGIDQRFDDMRILGAPSCIALKKFWTRG